MKFISSRTNPIIKEVAAVATSSYERSDQQLFVAEGLRVCTTLCSSGIQVQQLFATDSMLEHAKKLVDVSDLARRVSPKPEKRGEGGRATTDVSQICHVTDEVMSKISQATTPSGLLGVFHIPKPAALPHGPGIVLAQVREPGNVGTLIRSCAAFGMKTVVLVESADVWSPKVVQATAGALGSVNIVVCSWSELLARKGNLQLCALVVSEGSNPADLDLSTSLLVVGNEAQGIPDAWLADCEQRMTLPMPGGAESLNAAVAGSIGLYEMSLRSARAISG
jgi:TrmH family RNA methyltransferase